ncbi:serine hydrolase [Ancylobacter terrae]|uniref:serine hydrolase n=1 Tax=Ancylobacter sp. sgz301288 TaxID=3342077 RepID=UPI00385DFC4C
MGLMAGARWPRAWMVAGVVLAAACPARAEPVARDKVTAALPRLAEMARKAVTDGGVPGLAIAVVHNDEVVFAEGFGLRAMGRADLVDADTVFQIASLSKPVSSTVVAALVSDGVLDWDTRVAELAPEFQLMGAYPTQQVTVRDFFNHRSGLPGNAGDDIEDLGYGRDAVMARLRLVPPSSSFRAGYAYSNAGLTMGALAAVKPTGKSWEEVAEEKLFRPLGMKTTSYRYADFLARANRAALHVPVDGQWVAKLTRDPGTQAPAGGISSTVRDLAQWMRLELGAGQFGPQRLITPESIAATHVPLMARGHNPVTGAPSFYGLGWNIEYGRHGVSWGHAGAFSVGAQTLVTLYPEQQIGIVLLTNAFPSGVPEGLSASFFDLVFDGRVEKDWIAPWQGAYDSLFGPMVAAAKNTYAAPPTPATPALPADAYVGSYANDYVGPGAVAREGGALVLKLGPGGRKAYPLTHFDRDLFLIYPSPEMPDMPSAVRFAIGPDGRAGAITIEELNGNGLGTLARQP